jgi:hypothetical protein
VKTNLLLLSSLIATGCGGGVSEDDFGAEAAKSICAKMFECFDESVITKMYEDEAACEDALSGDYEPGAKTDNCDYDSSAAGDCLDAFDAMSCDDLKSGNTPPECDSEKICPSN